ncbi:MAG: twin-arginine translocation signal domain-containing protein [Salinivirgaceae bacterium]|jgi:WD40 repeat protein|nr:twin-arginine translocation signal domain-containing protein [Salinivirgaceae bacterium]
MKKKQNNKPQIFAIKKQGVKHTRRDFLKRSLVAGSAALGSGLLSSCDKDEEEEDRSDYKTIYTDVMTHNQSINDLDISADNKILASVSNDGNIKLWSIPDGKLIKNIEGQDFNRVNCLRISTDSNFFATGNSDHKVHLFSFPEGNLIDTFEGHTTTVSSLCFSPNGNILVSGSSDHTYCIWSMPDGQLLKTLEVNYAFQSIDHFNASFSPDGKLLATGSGDETVKIWDTNNWKIIHTIPVTPGNLHDICFSPDGTTLAIIRPNIQTIEFWSTLDWKLEKSTTVETISGSIIFYSRNGDALVLQGYEKIEVRNPESGELKNSILKQSNIFTAAAITSDATVIATGNYGHAIQLWQLPGFQQIVIEGSTCNCDTVCTCDTISNNNSSGICTCNTVDTCDCNEVCSCNSVSSGGGGSYYFPN